MLLKKSLLFTALLTTGAFASANSLETAFWPTTILTQPLRTQILEALNTHCAGGLTPDTLREDLTVIKNIITNEGETIRYYTTTFSSTYNKGKQKNLTQTINVESYEKFREGAGLVDSKVESFQASCPPVEAQ